MVGFENEIESRAINSVLLSSRALDEIVGICVKYGHSFNKGNIETALICIAKNCANCQNNPNIIDSAVKIMGDRIVEVSKTFDASGVACVMLAFAKIGIFPGPKLL